MPQPKSKCESLWSKDGEMGMILISGLRWERNPFVVEWLEERLESFCREDRNFVDLTVDVFVYLTTGFLVFGLSKSVVTWPNSITCSRISVTYTFTKNPWANLTRMDIASAYPQLSEETSKDVVVVVTPNELASLNSENYIVVGRYIDDIIISVIGWRSSASSMSVI